MGPHSETLIQATYSLIEKDLYEAQLRHAGRSSTFLQIIGGLVILSGAVTLVHGQYLNAVAPFILGLFFIFGFHLIAKFHFKRNFANQTEVNFIASDSGLEFFNKDANSSLRWTAIVKSKETKGLFMLYVQSNAFKLLPKRAFLPQDVVRLRELLSRQVKSKPTSRVEKFNSKATFFVIVLAIAVVLVAFAIHNILSSR